MRSPHKWTVLRELLKPYPAGTIVQVGANIGQFVNGFLKFCPKGLVYAIEAEAVNVAKLRERFGQRPRLTVLHETLAAEVGERTFYVNTMPGTHSLYPWNLEFLQAQGVPWRTMREETVTTNTLQNLCKREGIEQIAMLFMDVQGAELDVLRGAGDLIDDGRIELISGEYIEWPIYEGIPSWQDLVDYMEPRGYRLWSKFDKIWCRDGSLARFDFLFVKGA